METNLPREIKETQKPHPRHEGINGRTAIIDCSLIQRPTQVASSNFFNQLRPNSPQSCNSSRDDSKSLPGLKLSARKYLNFIRKKAKRHRPTGVSMPTSWKVIRKYRGWKMQCKIWVPSCRKVYNWQNRSTFNWIDKFSNSTISRTRSRTQNPHSKGQIGQLRFLLRQHNATNAFSDWSFALSCVRLPLCFCWLKKEIERRWFNK